MKFIADTHSHTLASGHAYSTIKEMAAAAEAKGLKALAITEHAPKMPGTCGLFYFRTWTWCRGPAAGYGSLWARR